MSFVPETKYYCDGCENKCELPVIMGVADPQGRKPRFQESVAYEYITKAQRIPRPYTSDDFKKETFIPDPYELCKQR